MNSIIPLDRSNLDPIKNLLLESKLPVEDLEIAPIQFYGLKNEESLLGIGALEIYGKNAIIRSVAVRKDDQNKGQGKLIISFLENKARELGIEKLFLLTTTADSYFKKRNYLSTNREACPPEIQASAEFANLCPSSANCLSKIL